MKRAFSTPASGVDVARVVDAAAFGKRDAWSSRLAGPPPFSRGETVEIVARSPQGRFVRLTGYAGMWRADRFAPLRPKEP